MQPGTASEAAKARQLLRTGQFGAAIPAFHRAIKRAPRDPSLLHELAMAQAQAGDYKAAVRSLQKALTLKPDSTLYLADLAQLYSADARYEDAERTLDRALRLDPAMAFAKGAKVELLQTVGRFDEARALAEAAIAEHPGDVRLAVAYAKLAPRINAEARAIETLERVLASQSLSDEARTFVLFRLADLLDRVGAFDRAFEAAAKANALVPARYEPRAHAAAIDQMIGAWTPQAIASMPRASRPTELPILIVGMLRSGTSLVEQILACHPKVQGGDELTLLGNICATFTGPYATHEPRLTDPRVLSSPAAKAGLDKAQRQYLGALYTLGGKASRVTDKMPGNFAHLGLVRQMLPGARVIHCTRDPQDTAVSCFFHHFQGSHPWCYRLDWIGAFYRDYHRLMRHWTTVLSDVPILEVAYEDLVADPDAWIPRLVEFAGLEWNDACMRFHESVRVSRTASNEQVRRPMYSSSVGRYKSYESHLGPLRAALGIA